MGSRFPCGGKIQRSEQFPQTSCQVKLSTKRKKKKQDRGFDKKKKDRKVTKPEKS